MPASDFPRRSGHPKDDPETLNRWLDLIAPQLNTDTLNPVTPALGDKLRLFDASASKHGSVLLSDLQTLIGGGTAATQTQMEAGSNNAAMVTPLATNWHPGVAKAWFKANGAGTTLNSSWNLTSITDTGTGRLTVTIATDFSSADYVAVGMLSSNGSAAANLVISVKNTTQAAGSCEIDGWTVGGVNADPVESYFVVFIGDQ